MTMISPAHPDPERLSAVAEGDPEALADRGLTDHLADCATCATQVRELATLRSALAELPDRMPPRRLQYVPPVAEPASRGWRVTLGRAFAPMVVAGMVLLLVGGVGATGVLNPDGTALFEGLAGSQSAPAAAPEYTTTDNGAPTEAPGAAVPGARGSDTETMGAAAGGGEKTPGATDEQAVGSGDQIGWVVVAILGLGLLVLAFVLRRVSATGSAPPGRPAG
jgi:anti-sigma factor RsiW